MSKKSKKNNMGCSANPRLDIHETLPENCYQMVNRFGRCNVQTTANTDNEYPAIAQGMAKKTAQSVENERKRWRHKNGEESGGKYKN